MKETKTHCAERLSLEEYFRRYPIPREVIVKEDILMRGLNFTDESLQYPHPFQEKFYSLFTFDPDPPKIVQARNGLIPQEIKISGGPYELRSTVIQSRHSLGSVYQVAVIEGRWKLLYGKVPIADVEFVPRPQFYDWKLSDGMEVQKIANTIYWGQTIDVTSFRTCEYKAGTEACKFCDIHYTFPSWKHLREGIDGAKLSAQKVAEAIELASHDPNTKRYLITGGAIKDGEKEVAFYLEHVSRTEEKLARGNFPCRLNTQAFRQKDCRTFLSIARSPIIYHPNLEVWGKELFERICPGKAHYIGWDEWLKRTFDAVEIFGVGNVSPNFVAGVEMTQGVFSNVDEAVMHTSKGIEYLMLNGVTPKFDNWAVEPLSEFGKLRCKAPPLDYFLKLYSEYYNLKQKYGLPWPNGLGEAGPGRSLVPASAFMDIGF